MSEIKKNEATGLYYFEIDGKIFQSEDKSSFQIKVSEIENCLIAALPQDILIELLDLPNALYLELKKLKDNDIDLTIIEVNEEWIGSDVISQYYFFTLKEELIKQYKLPGHESIIYHSIFHDGYEFFFTAQMDVKSVKEAVEKAVAINNSFNKRIDIAVKQGSKYMRTVAFGEFQIDVSKIFTCKNPNNSNSEV